MEKNNVNEDGKMALFLMVAKNDNGELAIKKSSVTSTHKGYFEGFVQNCGNKYGVDEKIPEGAILKYIFPDRKSIPSEIAPGMTERNLSAETAIRLKDPQDYLDLRFTVFSLDMGAKPIVPSSLNQGSIMSSLDFEDWEKANETGKREGFRAKYQTTQKAEADNSLKQEEKTSKQAKAYIPWRRNIPTAKNKKGRTI